MAREGRETSLGGKKLDLRVAQLAASQRGVLSLDELHACGLTDKAVMVRVRNGLLHPRYRGVYAVGHDNLDVEACWLAAVKACGHDAVLSHYSGACLWCLLEWDFRAPEVTAPTRREQPGIRTHKSQHIERTFRKGIPVTPPLRTLVDLSSMLPFNQLRRAVNEALNQRLVKPHELVTQQHRGARKLRAVVASGQPTKNEFEDLVLALLTDLPTPLVNQPLLGYVPDFLWPDQRVILEADGRATHDQLLARADDKRRQRHLEQHGYQVLRVTWRQATTDPTRTRERVRAALTTTSVRPKA
ncbi:MAG TPA: type IV toxin-antitoxin system AbiEi family antitoxin domain-containing protein [Solirubrobacter sp.]|nr:type IV toxin-antitoxin system AbiEi family antitoxin domain-containing protein [Solirubrobacter sp.]